MKPQLPVLIASLLVAIASGCQDSTGPLASSVTPAVTVSPAPNAMNVARGDTIEMMVGMTMDTASCRTRFTLHVGDSTGAVVPGHMRYGIGYQQMMFLPDSLLRPGTRYFVHMRDSVMVGNGMGGMGTMGGRQQPMQMMMFAQPPTGAMRMGDGMGWYFTTGS